MPRIRTIKPEFFVSEQVAECSTTARLLFVGLWCFSDDAGNHPASALRAKAEIFPSDNLSLEAIGSLLDELVAAGLIVEYTAKNEGGQCAKYWHITGFAKHQRIDRPSFQYPKFVEHSTNTRRTLVEHSSNTRRTPPPGVERKGKEGNRKGEECNRTGKELTSDGVPSDVCSATSQAKSAKPASTQKCPRPNKDEPVSGFLFSVVGPEGQWALPQRLYEKLGESYPGVDRDSELRSAQCWCETAGPKRKTAHGMSRFLNSWFRRAQDRASSTRPANNSQDPRGNLAALDQFLGGQQ